MAVGGKFGGKRIPRFFPGQPCADGRGGERGHRSVLRHSGLAEPGEVGLLEQCANLRRPELLGGLRRPTRRRGCPDQVRAQRGRGFVRSASTQSRIVGRAESGSHGTGAGPRRARCRRPFSHAGPDPTPRHKFLQARTYMRLRQYAVRAAPWGNRSCTTLRNVSCGNDGCGGAPMSGRDLDVEHWSRIAWPSGRHGRAPQTMMHFGRTERRCLPLSGKAPARLSTWDVARGGARAF
jgi:hypothetical protein